MRPSANSSRRNSSIAARRPLDQIGQSDAEFDHPLVITMLEQFGQHAGFVEQRPEFIPPARIVMADASRTVAGVAPDDDKLHAAAQIIGQSPHLMSGSVQASL